MLFVIVALFSRVAVVDPKARAIAVEKSVSVLSSFPLLLKPWSSSSSGLEAVCDACAAEYSDA
jgi:hypothetical protein